MDLRRSFERLSALPLQKVDSAGVVTPLEVYGSLQVYDRFVSDRDFGQKKRLFLVPGALALDLDQLLLKVADLPTVWLLEGVNYDQDASGVYASVAVLREARYRLKLYRPAGVKRASGVGYAARTDELVAETYGDFSRYSSSESREMDNIDYTIGSWYVPQGTPVDLDTIIEDSRGLRFLVREVSSFLDLLMVRVQEQEAVA